MMNVKIRRKKWTKEDDNILLERFQTEPLHILAKTIGCARSTISEHARNLGLYKDNPTGRNNEARELIAMEYDNLSYKEMAKRTGLSSHTVYNISRELGLRRTREQWNANLSSSRNELIRKERARILYGLDQKTKLKVVSDKGKIQLRGKLKKLGYIVKRGDSTFYYTEDLHRNPILEEHGGKFRFKFMPLPEMCVEETIGDSASPAISANG